LVTPQLSSGPLAGGINSQNTFMPMCQTWVGVLALIAIVGCKNYKPPSIQNGTTTGFLSDTLKSIYHQDYGFAVTYPARYTASIGWYKNTRIQFLKDSSSVLDLIIYQLDDNDYWAIGPEIRAEQDTIRAFVINRSNTHLCADGPDGSAHARTDSVKEWQTVNNLRAFVVFQTQIEDYRGENSWVPSYSEHRVAPEFWLDISNRSRKLALEFKNPRFDSVSSEYSGAVALLMNAIIIL
jgi:hypothetical protein